MKQMLVAIFLTLAVLPAQAETPLSDHPKDKGLSLMEEGAKLLLRGLMEDMKPALEDLHGMARDIGPFMLKLRTLIGDINNYHMPEMLPNGDIIIRHKTPAELAAPDGDSIDL